MSSLHPVYRANDQADLSRRAAERYAVLAAIKERPAQRQPQRRPRFVQVLLQWLPTVAPPGSSGW